MEYIFKPKGVCSMQIKFDLDGEVVRNISFAGGCDGNLKAVARLCDGMKAEDIIATLEGNDCRGRGTSCADQFTKGIKEAISARNAQKM